MNNNIIKLYHRKVAFKYGKEQVIIVQASCNDISYTDGFKGLTVRFFLKGENGKEHAIKFPFDYKFFSQMHDILKQEFTDLKYNVPSEDKFISER